MEESKFNIEIENGIATWHINSIGDINGKYVGKFKFKCIILPMDKILAGKEYRKLLGDNPTFTDENDSHLAWALTQLKYRIVEYPPFWNTSGDYLGNIADTNIIQEVLNAAVESELMYKESLLKKKKEALERAKLAAEKIAGSVKEENLEDGI